MSGANFTCRDAIEFVMHYLDNDLPPTQRAEFESHLRACPSCVAYLENYRKAMTLAKSSAEGAGAVPEELVRAILAARGKRA